MTSGLDQDITRKEVQSIINQWEQAMREWRGGGGYRSRKHRRWACFSAVSSYSLSLFFFSLCARTNG